MKRSVKHLIQGSALVGILCILAILAYSTESIQEEERKKCIPTNLIVQYRGKTLPVLECPNL